MNKKTNIKLKEISKESGWSQEQLATHLGVSFKTVNAWINEKSFPRPKFEQTIDNLYLDVVGRIKVEEEYLQQIKKTALSNKLTVQKIIKNKALLNQITLYLTYHTNTIEGSTMTLSDVKKVLEDNNSFLANKTVREQVEARNHCSALYFLLDELHTKGKNFTWSKDLILNTHLRLMNTIISDAGMFRRHNVRIMGAKVTLANYLKIPELIEELVNILNRKSKNIISELAEVHSKFEQIHPFSDGNGRTGRLIMLIQALRSGLVPPIILKERKRAYYKYLETAQLYGQFDLLEMFLAESIISAVELIKKN
jgi:Fic family protein